MSQRKIDLGRIVALCIPVLVAMLVTGCVPQTDVVEVTATSTTALPISTSTPTKVPTRTPTLVPTLPSLSTLEPLATRVELESVGPVYSLAWSPGGSVLASAGYEQVKLWDTETGVELKTLEGHRSFVWGVAWSPDGNRLASASQDGTVRLWDASTYEELAVLDTGWAFCVAWSPDGDQLAVGARSSSVQIWDVQTGELSHTLRANSLIISVGWSPDGRTIAAGQWDGVIRLWDTETNEELGALVATRDRSDANGLAWSPDGRVLASAHQDHKVRLWDIESGEILYTLEGHSSWVRGVAWSPDGRMLASTGDGARVCVWDAETGQRLASLTSQSLPIWSVAWSLDGSWLAIGNGVYEGRTFASAIVVLAAPSTPAALSLSRPLSVPGVTQIISVRSRG
ncbi:MAG: WD40 repeat domain-containing protein [Chloroflexi bacterium]|nr:WD40 repeat domain-containing protein [Chloroflexota bacterium]